MIASANRGHLDALLTVRLSARGDVEKARTAAERARAATYNSVDL
jgi:hypothetical protein